MKETNGNNENKLLDKIDQEFFDQQLGKIEKKPKVELEFTKTPQEQKRINKTLDDVTAKEMLKDIQEEYYDETKDFDVDKISKTNYLYQIFGSKHDEYKSSHYLKKEHKQMLAEGYPEGTLLNSYLFVAVVLRRLQIEFQQAHKAKAQIAGVQQPEDFDMLESIQSLTDKMSRIQSTLDNAKAASRTGQDVHDLHKKEVDAAAEFVKQHAGEFSYKCKKCHTIMIAGGLPHWAIISVEGDEVKYHIWSRELFRLVKKGLIPLHHMAFSLQTSLEGLKYTAELRGEQLPKFDINDEETKLKELMNGFEEFENKRQR